MTALVHHRRDTTVTPVVERRTTTITTTSTTGTAPDRSPTDRRSEIGAGIRSMLPWLVGVVPFGMVVGMNARTSGVSTAVGLATGSTIYSGSAQLTAIELLGSGADAVVVVMSVLVLNTRLLLYSSSIAPHWRGTSRRFRAAAAYLLIDPSFAVGMNRYGRQPTGGHAYYLAAAITLWVAWHAAMFGGAALGGGVPEWLHLHYAVPLFLLAELVHVTKSIPAVATAATAATIAVVGSGLPLSSGLLVSIVVGVAIGTRFERRAR
jgi:predicted branched-subunit amino acid permease